LEDNKFLINLLPSQNFWQISTQLKNHRSNWNCGSDTNRPVSYCKSCYYV